MPIVELPNGSEIEFPEGMTANDISAVMFRHSQPGQLLYPIFQPDLNKQYSYGHQTGASGGLSKQDFKSGMAENLAMGVYESPGQTAGLFDLAIGANPLYSGIKKHVIGTDETLQGLINKALNLKDIESEYTPELYTASPLAQGAARLAGQVAGDPGEVIPIGIAAKRFGKAGLDDILRARLNPEQGIIGYHGSPHKFSKFDHSMMGSGEGAQAYGWGTYLADNPEVAKTYAKVDPNVNPPPRRTFKGVELEPGTPEYHAATLVSNKGESLARTRFEVEGWIKEAEDWSPQRKADPSEQRMLDGWKKTLDTLNKSESKKDFGLLPNENLYEVDLPDEHVAKMLDWDAPLSEQPEEVRRVFEKLGYGEINYGGVTPARAARIGHKLKQKGFQVIDGDGTYELWAKGKPGDWTVINPHGFDERYADDIYDPELVDLVKERNQFLSGRERAGAAPTIDTGMTLDDLEGGNKTTVGELYTKLANELGGDAAASQKLNELGIPGIKYFDGNSRVAGEGTRNYVVFDEDLMTILKRNDEELAKKVYRGVNKSSAPSNQWWAESEDYAKLYAKGDDAEMLESYIPTDGLIDTRTPDGRKLYEEFLNERNYEPGYAPLLQSSGLPSYIDEWRFKDWLDQKGIKAKAMYFDEANGNIAIKRF